MHVGAFISRRWAHFTRSAEHGRTWFVSRNARSSSTRPSITPNSWRNHPIPSGGLHLGLGFVVGFCCKPLVLGRRDGVNLIEAWHERFQVAPFPQRDLTLGCVLVLQIRDQLPRSQGDARRTRRQCRPHDDLSTGSALRTSDGETLAFFATEPFEEPENEVTRLQTSWPYRGVARNTFGGRELLGRRPQPIGLRDAPEPDLVRVWLMAWIKSLAAWEIWRSYHLNSVRVAAVWAYQNFRKRYEMMSATARSLLYRVN